MADKHKNFAYSAIATAPSPAVSGTSLVVTSGQGALFPPVPFNATIWPSNSNALSTNAEIVRVTAISTDTLTIIRAQEGTSARTIIVGDQIAATMTARSFTDVELSDGVNLFNSNLGLRQFRSSLANSLNQAVNIVIYGNSISVGTGSTGGEYGYAQILRDYLQNNFGKGSNESIFKVRDDARFVKTVGTWAEFNLGGIKGKAYGETGTANIMTISNLVGTGIELFYVQNTFTTNPFTYSVDGGGYVSQNQSATGSTAAATVQKLSITGLTQGSHSIAIKAPATGYVFITAAASIATVNGVHFYNWAESGSKIDEFYNTADNRVNALQAMAPHLVIVSLSTNEYASQMALATYSAGIQAVITSAQAVGASVLLVSEAWRAGITETAGLTQLMYYDTLKTLATSNGVALLDLLDLFGSVTLQNPSNSKPCPTSDN